VRLEGSAVTRVFAPESASHSLLTKSSLVVRVGGDLGRHSPSDCSSRGRDGCFCHKSGRENIGEEAGQYQMQWKLKSVVAVDFLERMMVKSTDCAEKSDEIVQVI
jgi:hypothetical protein